MHLSAAYWLHVYKKLHTGIDATIISAENQNGATIVMAIFFSFAIFTSYENQITPVKHKENLEMKV